MSRCFVVMRRLFVKRTNAHFYRKSLARSLSTSSDDSKAKSVKAATEQWLNAVGAASPSKSTIAALLVAASPWYSGKVGGLYDGIAKITGAPTNEIIKNLQLAVTQLTSVAPNQNNQQKSIDPSGMATMTSFAQVYEMLRQQPPDKTCIQLADELQKLSIAASSSTTTPKTK